MRARSTAGVVKVTLDGGAGDDTIFGSRGNDTLIGGDGDDFIDGQQGTDVARMGAGDDIFRWDPGDGNDTVEGQDGFDTMLFNGNAAPSRVVIVSERRARAVHPRHRQHHHGPERRRAHRFNGSATRDNIVVRDLSGTDVTEVAL